MKERGKKYKQQKNEKEREKEKWREREHVYRFYTLNSISHPLLSRPKNKGIVTGQLSMNPMIKRDPHSIMHAIQTATYSDDWSSKSTLKSSLL